jgi:HEAT repeat protein
MATSTPDITALFARLAAEPTDAVRDEVGPAAASLGPAAERGLELLITTFRNPDSEPSARRAAVFLLGFIHSAVAVEPLIQGLLDSDAQVRWDSGIGLRRLADVAVPALLESIAHYSPDIRKLAGFALGVIGPAAAAAVPALEEMLGDNRPMLRQTADAALREILR